VAGGGGLTGNPSTSIFGTDNTNALGQNPVLYDPFGNPMYGDASDYGQFGLDQREEGRRKKLLEALGGAQGAFEGGEAYQPPGLLGPAPGIDMAPVRAPLKAQYSELPLPILMQLLLGRSG